MSQVLRPENLIEVAKTNNCKALEEILQRFPSQVDYTRGGVTALQEASYYGHIEAMKTLIRHDADLDISDFPTLRTPLHHAVDGNQPKAVHLLLSSNANVGEKNMEGLTAPQVAFRKKFKDCIKEFNTYDPNIVFKVKIEEAWDPNNCVPAHIPSPDPSEESSAVVEECVSESLQRVDDEDRCRYCAERTAIVIFRPCNHMYSCFECSASREVCQCGAPIEDRNIGDDEKVRAYIKDIKEFRHEYGKSQRKIDYLEKQLDNTKYLIVCSICTENPVDCVLSGCGHLFCEVCVRKCKNRDYDYDAPYYCPTCSKTSRFIRLYPEWETNRKRTW